MGRRGFTLLELLVVIAIMGIIMGSTIAAYFSIGQGARMRGAISTLQSNLSLARQRTIQQQVPLSVVFSNNVTAGTWSYRVVEADSGQRIGDVMHIPPGIEFATTQSSITFRPSGDADPATTTITLSEAGNPLQTKLTVYGLTGLVRADLPKAP